MMRLLSSRSSLRTEERMRFSGAFHGVMIAIADDDYGNKSRPQLVARFFGAASHDI